MATSITVNPRKSDLDRTDRLPILEGVFFEQDVEDDAVRLEYTTILHPAAPGRCR